MYSEANMIKLRKNNKGTSLVEVMAAMIVLAIGILGIAPLMVVTMDANSFSRELTRANTLAADRIEALRTTAVTFFPLPWIRNESNLENKYNRITRVDAYESDVTVPANVLRVHVTINWVDNNSLPRATEYWTYMTRR
jgi:type II secretory pathway pseudopilin PulG